MKTTYIMLTVLLLLSCSLHNNDSINDKIYQSCRTNEYGFDGTEFYYKEKEIKSSISVFAWQGKASNSGHVTVEVLFNPASSLLVSYNREMKLIEHAIDYVTHNGFDDIQIEFETQYFGDASLSLSKDFWEKEGNETIPSKDQLSIAIKRIFPQNEICKDITKILDSHNLEIDSINYDIVDATSYNVFLKHNFVNSRLNISDRIIDRYILNGYVIVKVKKNHDEPYPYHL